MVAEPDTGAALGRLRRAFGGGGRTTSWLYCRRLAAESRKRQAARQRPVELQRVCEFTQQGGLAFGADDPLDRFAALEQDHRRDRDDLEIARGVGVGVDVDFGDR